MVLSKVVILFAMWCFALGAGAAGAAWAGWSPYADASGHAHGGPMEGHGGYGGGHFYGPMHK